MIYNVSLSQDKAWVIDMSVFRRKQTLFMFLLLWGVLDGF